MHAAKATELFFFERLFFSFFFWFLFIIFLFVCFFFSFYNFVLLEFIKYYFGLIWINNYTVILSIPTSCKLLEAISLTL